MRTYACNEDGIRIVKYFNYEYDFNQGQCVESVKDNQERCDNRESSYKVKGRYEGEDDDLYEDRRRTSSRYRGGRRYRGRAAQTAASNEADTDTQEPSQTKREDQDAELPPAANKQQVPVPSSHKLQKHAKTVKKPE